MKGASAPIWVLERKMSAAVPLERLRFEAPTRSSKTSASRRRADAVRGGIPCVPRALQPWR